MTKVRLTKKQVFNKDKGVIISHVETKNRNDENLKKLEKGMTDIVKNTTPSGSTKDDFRKNGVVMLKWKGKTREDYKTKTFTTDVDGKVFEFKYKGRDYEGKKGIFRDMKITFSGKPSMENAQGLSDLIMNK